MKKSLHLSFVLLLMVAAIGGANAQQIKCSFSGENSKFDNVMSENLHIVGMSDDQSSYYAVTCTTINVLIAHVSNGLQVVELDRNMNIKKSCNVSVNLADYIPLITMHDGVVHIFMLHEENKESILYHTAVNVATMSVIKQKEELVHSSFARNDNSYFWINESENKDFIGFITYVTDESEDTYTANAFLFDADMKLVWKRQCEIDALSDIRATNDGNIATMGYDYVKNEFLFSLIEKSDMQTYRAPSTSEAVSFPEIVNYHNGKMIVSGLLVSDPSAKRPSGRYQGAFGLAFDLAKGKAIKMSIHQFDIADKAMFENQSTKYKFKKDPEHIVLTNTTPTSFGGVASFQAHYSVTVQSQNGTSTVFHNNGVCVIGIDTTGDIRWNSNMRCFAQSNSNWKNISHCLFSVNGDTYLIQSEHAKSPKDYTLTDIAKPMRFGLLAAGHLLAIYKISADGTTTKTVVEDKSPYGLSDYIYQQDAHHFLCPMSDGKISRFASIEIL